MNNGSLERFELVVWGTLVKMSKKLDAVALPAEKHRIQDIWSWINSRVVYQSIVVVIIGLLLGITSGYLLPLLLLR
jgi:hypothetical protein